MYKNSAVNSTKEGSYYQEETLNSRVNTLNFTLQCFSFTMVNYDLLRFMMLIAIDYVPRPSKYASKWVKYVKGTTDIIQNAKLCGYL